MKFRTIALVLSTLVFASVPLFASGSKESSTSGGKVTLRFGYNWTGANTQAKAFEGGLDRFAADHASSIDLKLEATPGNAYRQKILTLLAGGDLPDAFMWWGDPSALGALVSTDALLPIDDLVAADPQIKLSDFNTSAVDRTKVGGTVYGIPIEIWLGYVLANKALFTKYNVPIPQTWEQVLSATKVFRANGIIPFALTSKGGVPANLFLDLIVDQLPGGQAAVRDITSSLNFNTPPILKAAEIMSQLKKEGIIPQDTVGNGGYGASLALYNGENAAMVYTFTWMTGAVKPNVLNDSVVIPPPRVPGGTVDPATIMDGDNGMAFVVNKKSFASAGKEKAIVALANLITSDGMIQALEKAGMPAAKTVSVPEGVDPLYRRVMEYARGKTVLNPIHSFFPAGNQQAYSTYHSDVDALLAGTMSAQQFVSDVQQALKQ